jgi:hypothetical protein
MDRTYKTTIAVVISLCILAVAVYGSYMPMRKSEIFIGTLQNFQVQPPTSLQDLEARLSVPLDYPSPIGQEELVRNTANSVLSLVQRGSDATTTGALIGFLDSYYGPFLARGKGMSFGQDLYLEGAVNEIAFAQTGASNYLQDALKYYQEANVLGPNRPQALYGLFDVYRAIGDATDTKAVAATILANWPTDTSIAPALAQFLSTRGTEATTTRK